VGKKRDSLDELPESAGLWQFGEFELDQRSRELRCGGGPLELEPKPFNLLVLLLHNAGELVTKEELFDSLWRGSIVTDSVLTRCVSKLRQALGDSAGKRIITVHGYGYRLQGEVRHLDDEAPPPQDLAAGAQPEPGDPLPYRSGWRYEKRLGGHGHTWRIVSNDGSQRRVVKQASSVAEAHSLYREHSLYSVLFRAYGESGPFVRVLELIAHETLPALEFEYLPAGSLGDWYLDCGGADGVSLECRIDLAIQIAEALNAVHQAGILHKDLKPSNLLIEIDSQGAPRVRLADFGTGHLLQRSRLIELGLTRGLFPTLADSGSGTPFYTAPEVLDQQTPTVRSDIYSLGVLLYQLVTGDLQRAFTPGWERDVPDEMLRSDIADCADRDPARRLGSADELATRLRLLAQRRRNHEAQRQAQVEAQLAGEALKLAMVSRRWSWRLALTLTAALLVSAVLGWNARQEQRRAEVNAATSRAINGFLNDDLLAAANPYLGDGGRNVTVASVLDAATDRLHERLGAQPEVMGNVALSLGGAYENLGLQEEAERLYGSVLAELTPRLGASASVIRDLTFNLAYVEVELARLDLAALHFEALRRQAEAEHGPWAMDTIRARYGAAWVTFEQGDYVEAARRFELLDEGTLAAGFGDTPTYIDICWNRAEAEIELHHWALAEQLMRFVVERYTDDNGADSARVLYPSITLGYIHQMRGQFDLAEAELQSVYERSVSLLGERHPVSYSALHHLGILRLREHRYQEAEQMFQAVVSGRTRLYGEQSFMTRYSMNRLAQAWLALGRNQIAEALFERTWQASVERLGEAHPNSLDISRGYAMALAANGKTVAAEQRLRRALELAPQHLPPNNNRIGATHLALSDLLQTTGHLDEALAEAQAGEQVLRNAFGPEQDEVQAAQRRVASLSAQTNDDGLATAVAGPRVQKLKR